MKTLASEDVKAELLAFRLLQKESKPAQPPNILKKLQYRTMTWLALYSGLPAPRGIPTAAAVDQEKNGTPPIGFEEDKETMIQQMNAFSDPNRSYENCFHPIFGELTPKEWQRWGYTHVDHHFKQFGI